MKAPRFNLRGPLVSVTRIAELQSTLGPRQLGKLLAPHSIQARAEAAARLRIEPEVEA